MHEDLIFCFNSQTSFPWLCGLEKWNLRPTCYSYYTLTIKKAMFTSKASVKFWRETFKIMKKKVRETLFTFKLKTPFILTNFTSSKNDSHRSLVLEPEIFFMYFISLFYGFFNVDFLWGNKQIKNAVEAWEKTFSPSPFLIPRAGLVTQDLK